jgi:uridine kinase
MENNNIKVTNKSKGTKTFPKNTPFIDVCRSFGYGKEIIGAKVGNEVFALCDKVPQDCEVTFFDLQDINGNKIYKSGLQFIFEVALKETFPELEITYEHSVPKGFLGEIVGDKIITQEDLVKIKSLMAKIISEDKKFKKLNISKKEAIKFYLKINQTEKAYNIQNISDKVVTFYELNGFYNFFYSDMPYSTGSITTYDIIFLGRNRLVFVIPSKRTKGLLPEYVHYDNIINSFLVAKNWLDTQNMKYITSINNTVSSNNIKQFIDSTELVFNMYVEKVANTILNNRNIKFVLIAGPSSSGKTTTSKRMSSYFRAQGFEPINISIDDFFLEREESPKDENGNYDFECLTAIDLDLFNKTLKGLLNGERVSMPSYNFVTGKKEYNENYIELKDNSIILIEGLHALNDDLLPSIDNKLKYKIYLSPFIPVNIDRHNYISTIDLRLIRRIIRDNRSRNYDVSSTIDKWQSVRRGEEKYIFPFIHQADTIINTALAYELGVEKVYAEPLLRSVDVNSNYYEEARRLLDFLKIFYPIPSEYVSKDSILREFIGGNE